MKSGIILGIDPGSKMCGVAVLAADGRVLEGHNVPRGSIVGKIKEILPDREAVVVLEDIKPYSLALKQNVIDTCKLLGELEYRLPIELGVEIHLLARTDVRKWVFDRHFPDLTTKIVEKIAKKGFEASDIATREPVKVDKTGKLWKPRAPSWNYIDDRLIIAAMRVRFGIPALRGRQKNQWGMASHAWQALALACAFQELSLAWAAGRA